MTDVITVNEPITQVVVDAADPDIIYIITQGQQGVPGTLAGRIASLNFGTNGTSASLVVVDATIEAGDYVRSSIVQSSTMTAAVAVAAGMSVATIATAGVGYTIYASTQSPVTGIIGVVTDIMRTA